ncbi:HIT finger domain-containing protein [Sporormia fimetaria CBS 119925]|uniref:Box C/D snoRNA protein 1 n=1 Tax=Sporormia fimetaria CBS 119925 TaxID=1340428 RepID=A0A6A6VCJ0_9PLEO|nr:HIT finger domain-containing protein [Sporormia fimetaria CBS 119925]
MADEALLSDLCSICNTTKSKYRCPGCSSRTCSLPCYKKHQTWAQCTGKRDPTAYVKKSQLATPAGIDHDYNFLSSIERGLQKAERDVESKVDTSESQGSKKSRPSAKHLSDAGITVIRAPKGLSRERENRTQWSKKKHIQWTVEWIHPDKSRTLSGVSEKAHIGQAYQYHVNDLDSQKVPAKKRKLEHQKDSTNTQSQDQSLLQETDQPDEPAQKKTEIEVPSDSTSSDAQALPQQTTNEPDEHTTSKSTTDQPSTFGAQASAESRPEAVQPPPPTHYFFLHRPRTLSPLPVLIPVSRDTTLQSTLRGRTILEFPTIYVFNTPDPPVADFVLDQEYEKQEREKLGEFESVVREAEGELGRGEVGAVAESEGERQMGLDESKIADVLKLDLGGVV